MSDDEFAGRIHQYADCPHCKMREVTVRDPQAHPARMVCRHCGWDSLYGEPDNEPGVDRRAI